MERTANRRPVLPPALSSIVIDELGGVTAVSKICEISTAAVAQWRKKGIPKPRVQFLRERFRGYPVMSKEEIQHL